MADETLEQVTAQACHDTLKEHTPALYDSIAKRVAAGMTPRGIKRLFEESAQRQGKETEIGNAVYYTAWIIQRSKKE